MPTTRTVVQKHPLATLALVALFVLSAAQALRSSWDRFDEILHGGQLVTEDVGIDLQTLSVNRLGPASGKSGLRKGDILLTVNGRPIRGLADLEGPVRNSKAGEPLIVTVKRPGDPAERQLSVPLLPFTYVGYTPGSPGYVITILFRIFTPLFCLALGFWVAAVRIADRAAWALLFMMLSLSNLILDDRTIYGYQDALQPLLTALSIIFLRLGPLALAYFGIVFPEPPAFDRKYPWLKWIVLGPMVVRAVLPGIASGLLLHHHDQAMRLWPIVVAVDLPASYVELALIALFFITLAYKSLTAATPDARRRLMLLDTGAAVGLLPVLITLTWMTLHQTSFRGWSALFSIAALLVFPLTMAYVIVVNRAMDVRVAVRQGLQYLLATGGVRFLQIAISAAIIVLAATMSANSGVGARVALIATGFALLAGIGAFADRLRGWIDRRFFREAYEADRILSDLAARVRTMVETGPLLETVASRIAEALHVPRIAILLDGNGSFHPAHALGYPSIPTGTFSDQGVTLRRLHQTTHTTVELHNPDSWVQLTDRQERAALEELKPELLLPLSLKEKIVGIMSLGPKQSEEPFSPTDLRLLDSVAAQTGLALENGRLTETIKNEVRAREKQNRELELAREVQERLFPQDYPVIAGLEYAGACRPALGVGGDYYDFIPISNGGLGIAIGDVSGKGIPAALLMATLRAFLRGQTIDRDTDLRAVIANLNRLVFESSAQNRYATFFLATYDSTTRLLRYVNAGHNAPAIIRQTGEVLLLEATGSVVGLMPGGEWESGQVHLNPGDLFVAFTDGVSEAMNHEDEEWGEDQLIAAARSLPNSPPKTILDHVVKSADAFAAGAPQHDDLTLIVARVS